MFDVIEILDRYGIEYKPKGGASSELLILCPFHNDNNFGSAMINEETGIYNCFSCKEGGNIYKLVSQLEQIEYSEAYKLVENNFNEAPVYDIDELKNRKESNSSLQSNYNKLASKLVNKILTSLIGIYKKDFRYRWMVVCNWIRYVPEENIQDKYNKLLIIYQEFQKEIKAL